MQKSQQKIYVETALMRLVNDDSVVLFEESVLSNFCEQQPVGHDLDQGVVSRLI